MFMNDIRLFTKTEKNIWRLIQTIRIYKQDRGMGFGKGKSDMLIMENGKREITE